MVIQKSMGSKGDTRQLKDIVFFSDRVQVLKAEYNHGQAQDDAHFEDMLLVVTSSHAILFSLVHRAISIELNLSSEVERILEAESSQLVAFEVRTKVNKKMILDLLVIRTDRKGRLLDYLRLP